MKKIISISLLINFYILCPIFSFAENITDTTSTADGNTYYSSNNSMIETKNSLTTETINDKESTLSSSSDYLSKEKKAYFEQANLVMSTSLTGNGTVASPFKVYNEDHLATVAKMINDSSYTTTTNSGTVYINLMSDITLDGNMINFINNRNPIIIDGATNHNNVNNFSIFFTGNSTSGYGLFSLGSANMTITFKNINFGSKEFAKNNYYGFCQTTKANNTINIQDVNYYAEEGGQPFYSTGSNSVLNFIGYNTFVVTSNGVSNQEFAEFSGAINFKEDSKTAIVQKTNTSLAFIWIHSNLTMNVESNAEVFIQSGKTELFYPSKPASLNIDSKAKFTYLFDNKLTYIDPSTVFADPSTYQYITVTGNTGATSNNFFDSNSTLDIFIDEQAQLNFITSNLPFQTGKLVINSQDSSSVKFMNQTQTNPALNSKNTSIDIKNSTTNNTIYNFRKSPNKNGDPISELVLPNKSSETLTNNLSNYNVLAFEPAVKVGGVSAMGSSGFDVESKTPFSKITSQLTDVSSTLDSHYTYKAQYYITSDTNNILSDTTLNNLYKDTVQVATHIDGSINKPVNTIPSTPTITSDKTTSATLNHLFSGMYIIYGRLAVINTSDNQTFYTTWNHLSTEIKPYQAVTLPTLIDINADVNYRSVNNKPELIFNNKTTYPISNQSNQIINIKPTLLIEKNQNNIDIVPDKPNINNDKKKLQLQLISNPYNLQWNLGDLTSLQSLELQPYWDTSHNKTNFNLGGAYSGPYLTTSPATLNYTVVFSINPK
ncbi:hypothetical protein [Vagococcus martis]